jgi:phosphonate transport system ATP-binding protein
MAPLTIDRLEKIYAKGQRALAEVSLQVAAGERVALIGASGAGKSTLLRCINRLVEPSSGQVFLGELAITAVPKRELRAVRQKIGMVFQEFALVERLTVMENVLAGALAQVGFWASAWRRFPPHIVNQALELVDCVGLSAHLDQRADTLSGGQRQRVGIARALLQNPEFLLVDEPTASLDPRTAQQIMRLLTTLAAQRGIGMIVNLHDVPLAKAFFPRLVGLKGGHIVFDGTAAALDYAKLQEIYGAEDWQDLSTEAVNGAGRCAT